MFGRACATSLRDLQNLQGVNAQTRQERAFCIPSTVGIDHRESSAPAVFLLPYLPWFLPCPDFTPTALAFKPCGFETAPLPRSALPGHGLFYGLQSLPLHGLRFLNLWPWG
jgi:hypothetical protein